MTGRGAIILLATLGLGGCATLAGSPSATVPLATDLGNLHHPITTDSPLAQRYFDQGLRLTYGFNHAEAIQSYEQAAQIDPDCAMCYWGIAFALGPNINMPMAAEAEVDAYKAVHRARGLARTASEGERAYIDALAVRYGEEPGVERVKRDGAYADAMREVARRFPNDPDAGVLFADALMNTQPWDYWTAGGEPKGSTPEIVSTLEAVIERHPDHPGACHLYIHAVEASTEPERALSCADRLPGLMPGAGHVVHMPAHIYIRVGQYEKAVERNLHAVAVDERYIEHRHPTGVYPAMYYPHNLHFLWAAASIEGRSKEALTAARKLAAAITDEQVNEIPPLEFFLPTPLYTLARFGRWQAILDEPAPSPDFHYATGMWHYARGLALTATGRLDEAQRELDEVTAITAETPEDKMVGINSAAALLEIAGNVLGGELAARRGRVDDAVEQLQAAVHTEGWLTYDEPPPWYQPAAQFLGAVLLDAGRADEAEAVYREDLEKNPRNGWSLYGLMQSLRAQRKLDEAAEVERAFTQAWARADVVLTASRFD